MGQMDFSPIIQQVFNALWYLIPLGDTCWHFQIALVQRNDG
jgi:hypothetical protein